MIDNAILINRPFHLECSIRDVTPGVPRKACWGAFSIVIIWNRGIVKESCQFYVRKSPKASFAMLCLLSLSMGADGSLPTQIPAVNAHGNS